MAADVSRAAGWVWTVDLDWAGRRYRLAEQALSLPDVSGVILDYSPGLSRVGYEARLDLLETDPAVASVPIAVDLGPDLPVLLGDGHELRLAYAVVRLVPVDAAGAALGDYADGITIAAGTLRQIQTADPDAPTIVEAQVGDEPGQGTGPLLPPSGVIRQETWSTAADAAEGKAYPLVVGSPGSYPRGASTLRCPGSPVYVVTSSGGGRAILGVVAGHAVAAGSVDVYNRTKDVWLTALPVVTTADLTERYRELYELHSEARDQAVALRDLANASLSQLGSAVTLTDIGHMYGVFGHPGAFDLPRSLLAVVDFSPLAVGDQPETEDELWAAWVDGPGLVDETGTEITTAGQLLLWLLRRSGLQPNPCPDSCTASSPRSHPTSSRSGSRGTAPSRTSTARPSCSTGMSSSPARASTSGPSSSASPARRTASRVAMSTRSSLAGCTTRSRSTASPMSSRPRPSTTRCCRSSARRTG